MSPLPRLLAVIAAGFLALTAFAACGSDDDSSSAGSSNEASTDLSSVPAPTNTPPREIFVKQPLGRDVPTGKTAMWMECETEGCRQIGASVRDATKAVGWRYKSIAYKSADAAAALESALQQKPDAIMISGIASANVRPQLAAAAKAGVPVLASVPGPERPSETTYRAISSVSMKSEGDDLARWVTHDSKGKGNVLLVTTSSFPILGTIAAGVEEGLKQHCPGCTSQLLDVTIDEASAGQAAPKVVAHLQTNPDTDYILFVYTVPWNGVPEALKAAGLDKDVKLIGNDAESPQIKGIANGSGEAWASFPRPYQGWVMVDAALRLVDGGKLPEGYQKQLDRTPWFIIDNLQTAKSLAPSYLWDGPEGMADQFKKLWGVDGG